MFGGFQSLAEQKRIQRKEYKNIRIAIYAVIAILFAVSAYCTVHGDSPEITYRQIRVNSGAVVNRFVDPDNGIVCYSMQGYANISCTR